MCRILLVIGVLAISTPAWAIDTAPLPGDYNGNGVVEQADLNLVLLNWGEELVPQNWVEDLPSGPIDQAELSGVLLSWGNTGGGLAAPEPSTAGLLLVFSILLVAVGRYARRPSRG